MMKTFMKSVICVSFGYIYGEKYEDGQTVTNKVPFAQKSFKLRITEPMLDFGRKANLNSFPNRP